MAEQEPGYRGERSEGSRHEGRREGGREGGRRGPDRDGTGLRIRLSDNELRAARTIQDAFQLKSTVAVMGFCLRTMAQLLEQGALEGVAEQPRSGGGRGTERGERGDRRGGGGAPGGRGPRPDPFARPSRPPAPVAAEPVADEAVAEESVIEPPVVDEPPAPETPVDEAAGEAAAEATPEA